MLRRIAPRRTLLGGLLFANLLLFFLLYFLFSGSHDPPPHIARHPYFHYDLQAQEPGDSDQKCVLPRVHPFDPSIWGFLQPPKALVCKGRNSDLTYIDERGWLRFNATEVEGAGYRPDELSCTWAAVTRPEGDDDNVVYGSKVPLAASGTNLPPDIEIVNVRCSNFLSLPVYEKLHVRIRDIFPEHLPKAKPQKLLNVLIFGLDSMSRLSFIRLLPNTYKYLTDTLGMTVFRGMNKVGDNTYPNLIPILTGHKAYGGGLEDSPGMRYDDFPLIWKSFSAAGYGTLWAEDFPQYGLFNYLARGFSLPPTDHYLRPFWIALEHSSLLKRSSHLCYGSQPKYMLQLEYTRRFVSKYSQLGRPFFGFSFLAEISHEYTSRIASADDRLENFFRGLKDEGYLDDTLLLVLSDHGHRFDAVRTSQVGHIEERLPFHALRLPPSVAALQPALKDKLRANAGRLTTPFDAHATLRDALNFASSSRLLGQAYGSPSLQLGQSLFQEVPADRTCAEAHVPEHFCVCEAEVTIPVTDVRAQVAADATLRHLNALLSNSSPDCSALRLGHVRDAHLVSAGDGDEGPRRTRVRVVLVVEPSHGVLESSVLVQEGRGQVVDEVSRLDPYREQSRCLRHAVLRKYCFCGNGTNSGF